MIKDGPVTQYEEIKAFRSLDMKCYSVTGLLLSFSEL